jgi:hypothetical protein
VNVIAGGYDYDDRWKIALAPRCMTQKALECRTKQFGEGFTGLEFGGWTLGACAAIRSSSSGLARRSGARSSCLTRLSTMLKFWNEISKPLTYLIIVALK